MAKHSKTVLPVLQTRPEGALCFMDGSFYKLTDGNTKLWFWHNGQWCRSCKDVQLFLHKLRRQDEPFGY